jgi:hypothetical protein
MFSFFNYLQQAQFVMKASVFASGFQGQLLCFKAFFRQVVFLSTEEQPNVTNYPT